MFEVMAHISHGTLQMTTETDTFVIEETYRSCIGSNRDMAGLETV